jgi:Cu2+-exporting ATPase
MGIESVILTGDNELTAQAVQRKVGAKRAIAGVLPQDKERIIGQDPAVEAVAKYDCCDSWVG